MSDVWTPPRAQLQTSSASNPEAAEIRRRHLNHEASVRALGTLYFIGAVGAFLAGVGLGIATFASPEREGPIIGIAVAAFVLGLGALYFWIARGLRGLKSQARIPAGILAALGLLGFPIGTLINGYILYLLFSAKGKMVFSDEYQQVIADTPDIKYRTSIVVWILVALLVAFFVFVIISATARH